MTTPTPQSPVSEVTIPSNKYNPFNLTTDIRDSLSEVFCAAIHSHKSDYLTRKHRLAEHLAKEDHDKKDTPVLVSLCQFSERHLKQEAQTYKAIMGSDFWIKEVEKIIQEAENA